MINNTSYKVSKSHKNFKRIVNNKSYLNKQLGAGPVSML